MNYKKGFFRILLVIYVSWVIYVFYIKKDDIIYCYDYKYNFEKVKMSAISDYRDNMYNKHELEVDIKNYLNNIGTSEVEENKKEIKNKIIIIKRKIDTLEKEYDSINKYGKEYIITNHKFDSMINYQQVLKNGNIDEYEWMKIKDAAKVIVKSDIRILNNELNELCGKNDGSLFYDKLADKEIEDYKNGKNVEKYINIREPNYEWFFLAFILPFISIISLYVIILFIYKILIWIKIGFASES